MNATERLESQRTSSRRILFAGQEPWKPFLGSPWKLTRRIILSNPCVAVISKPSLQLHHFYAAIAGLQGLAFIGISNGRYESALDSTAVLCRKYLNEEGGHWWLAVLAASSAMLLPHRSSFS